MHFGSLFSPSLLLIFFVLDSCRPTAAAALAISPVKRGSFFDEIECPGPLPVEIPPDFPIFPNLHYLCESRLEHPKNLDCRCVGEALVCGFSYRPNVQTMVAHCLNHCDCGPITRRVRNQSTGILYWGPVRAILEEPVSKDRVPDPVRAPSGNSNGAGVSNPINTQTCSHTQTCTNVNHGCGAPKKACKCYAVMATKSFYRYGYCGPSRAIGHKRDLAQQRRSHYLNATARFASTAPSGPPPDLAVQLASGLLPSPCNASYISFGCADSTNGIVHEPPQNWLGALVPEDAKDLPPVPEEFLRIHGVGGEGTSQVVVE